MGYYSVRGAGHSLAQLKMSRYVETLVLLFFWFAFVDLQFVYCELSSNQRDTLVKLSGLLPNSTASSPSPWNVTKEPNPCLWKGVLCRPPDNSSVIHLSLSYFSLSASDFLTAVCQIESLQTLDVSNNRLGSIPDGFITGCGEISGLKLLNLSRNWFSGNLPDFHGFVGLESLDMSHNKFNGNIDKQLDELAALKSLNLSYNQFSGRIPIHLGKTKLLEELELSANSFQERIPEEIAEYQNLILIDLSNNLLSGSLPDRIGELSKLEVLILSSNDLTGEIPRNLANIRTLSRFAANQNGFLGAIPTGLTRFLRNLDLSYNKLNGPISSDLLAQSNLQTVDLSYNLLEGSIPANLSTSLVRLRLGSNSLNGTIPSTTFGFLQKLMYLELDNNSLSGSIPSQLRLCQNLALLNLANNILTGALPVELGDLTGLQVLKLQLNNLTGNIPVQIAQLHSLSVLNISWNSISGVIPSLISGLQNLTILNLQGNNLNGSLPTSIGSLNSLLELQLGKNQLSGKIPEMPRNLKIALNLSSNLFEGPIPNTLVRLDQLEVLDLSSNRLSGVIPNFLANMGTLTQVILSNNLLSGEIPKFNSWVDVNTTGNEGLVRTTPSPSVKKSQNNKKSVAVVLVAAAAAAISVGVITIIALVIFRRIYRVKDDDQFESRENFPQQQVIIGNLLTVNGIHRANIDFVKALEAVGAPSNIVLKSRFSTYYKATMPSGTSYFIKKLNWSDKIFQLGSHEKFEKDLQALGKLNNSNVLTPLAYVLTADSAYLFYEFAQKGTLFDMLHGNSTENAFDWASRYSIALGVAQGLAFLHGCTSGPVLLLDLSSKSILLKTMKEPQIGDIELCKVIDLSKSTGSLSTVAGSVGYVPPEYAYTMRVTMAGNVYSFGVILLELLTGKPSVNQGTELAKWVMIKSARESEQGHILDFSISRASPAVRSQMLAVLKVALSCVSATPEARPKMKSVLRMLLNAR